MNFDFLTGLFKTQTQEIAEIQQERDKVMAGGNYYGNIAPNLQAQQQNSNPYQQYGNQQSPAGPLVGGGNGLGGYSYNISQGYPTVSLPNITGARITIAFTDARGTVHAIEVDQAYAGILTQISHNHAYCVPQQAATNYIPPIKAFSHPKMLDGDFTEDEMTQAEQIIQEMGGSNGQEPYQAA